MVLLLELYFDLSQIAITLQGVSLSARLKFEKKIIQNFHAKQL